MDAPYKLSAKRLERNVLEAELGTDELWEYDEYQRLQQQIAELERQVENEQGGSNDVHPTETAAETQTQP